MLLNIVPSFLVSFSMRDYGMVDEIINLVSEG